MLEGNGWVKLHRRLFENELWLSEPFTKAQAWIDLFANANHKSGSFWVRGIEVCLERGQLGWSKVTMAKRWRWNIKTVRRFLDGLEKGQQIGQQISNETTIITIKNYDTYQSEDSKEDTKRDSKRDSKRDTNKNDKNDKKYIPEINSGKPTGESSSSPLEVKENKDIGWVIHAFKEINPTMVAEFYKRKPQREAARDLIRTFGLEATLTLIDNYKKVRHKEFCPSISSPLELKTKYSKFNDFYSSPNNK